MKCLSLLVLYVSPILTTPQNELLEFSAKWCGPCQQIAPMVDRLHRQGLPIRKIDIDQNRDLARKYGVQSIPAFVLIVNGRAVEHAAGLQSEQRIMQMLARIPKSGQGKDNRRFDAPLLVQNGNHKPAQSDVFASHVETEPQRRPVLGLPNSGRQNAPRISNATLGSSARNSIVRAKLDDKPFVTSSQPTSDPMVASARLRISDPSGINLGSGTIIDSRVGVTLILTCGHIFRDFKNDSMIEVDVFLDGKKETFVGKSIKFDLATDLGLVSIPTDVPVPFARIADLDRPLLKGAAVQSVGCGQGNDPTLQKHLVTRLNRYQGPDNIECTGVPILGRSGGGLFNSEGEVVGLCMAADEEQRRGLYLGLKPIISFLQQCQDSKLVATIAGVPNPQAVVEPEEFQPGRRTSPDLSPTLNTVPRGLNALKAALGDDFSEDVICLVTSKNGQESQQKVVVFASKAGRAAK